MRIYPALFGLLLASLLNGQSFLPDSLQRQLQTLSGKEKINLFYRLAEHSTSITAGECLSLGQAGLTEAMAIQDAQLITDGLILVSDLARDLNQESYADSVLHEALLKAQANGYAAGEMKSKMKMARQFSTQGEWRKASDLLHEVYLKAREQGDSLTQAKSLMHMGLNFQNAASYDSSLFYMYQALDLHKSRHDLFNTGIAHTNIGMTFLRSQRFDDALTEFQTAYTISSRISDNEGLLINMLNMGVVYQKKNELEQATATFVAALQLAKAQQSWMDIALLNANLGTVAMAQENYAEARERLERAIAIKDSLGLQNDLPHSLNSLAEVYLRLRDTDTAIEKAKQALQLARNFHLAEQESQANRILSDIYLSKKDYASAYTFLLRFKELSDSMYTEERDHAVSDLKIRYETRIKEDQIARLTYTNQQRKTRQWIYLGIAALILITAVSLIYAIYTRYRHDKILLTKERELHERQNQFFVNISHEFRTPLTLILGPLYELKEKWTQPKDIASLRIIQKNAERLLQLINQILDLTKLDMQALELKREWSPATLLIRGVCSSFDSLAENREITYTYTIQPGLSLYADLPRLEIVLINLISNAFKFTPDKGSIHVDTLIDETGPAFKIVVRDSGTGIDAEKISRIFDRYYHDDREAHSDYEGAGIGLALSKQIVEMHGGKIEVRSTIEAGTTFSVILPFDLVRISQDQSIAVEAEGLSDDLLSASHSTQQSTEAMADEKPIVLLVEDRLDMRDYIASILDPTYRVLQAANAVKGWDFALEYIPDIIISDVMMPGKNGFELCKDLKTDPRTSHIPVLLLTARSTPEDRLTGLETEADVYLTKPFIPHELELQLHNLLISRKKTAAFYAQHKVIEPAKLAFNSVDQQFMEAILHHLEINSGDENFNVTELSQLMNLSRSQLHRKLQALTGQVPNRLIRTFRLKKAYDLVKSNAASISEIAYQVGFGSPAYFTKCFAEEFGVTPAEARDKLFSL